ncbi:MAG: FAD-dependent oxidoreductase [Actinomycetaceae bacterium]|nr:FAD-dependent oxidoreductase [Arcanobacterium sp.]MDD7505022.1 FAD-dependent oxidoreductase [Actinomycetaceae bacterium]MDY6143731.1 FAD-dependent oxidoreductase [Arcanobacterium sp.]
MRLVIVGGVAGGMSAAARARRLDEHAEIIVLEQGEYVSFANCGLPYFVGGEITDPEALLLHTPQSLRAALNLDVRINHRVVQADFATHQLTLHTPSGVQTLHYDALILSPGAKAINPLASVATDQSNPYEGHVHTLRTVDDARALRSLAAQGKTAVVVGAGFIGLEAAEALAMRGLDVHIVELSNHVLPPLERELASLVEAEIRRLGIRIHTGTEVTAIDDSADGATVTLSDSTQIQADAVVLSVGVKPETEVFISAGLAHDRGAIIIDEHGRTNQPDVYAVGDATIATHRTTGARQIVALAGPANRTGRLVADYIFNPGKARPLPALLGTSIVRIGKLAAGITGANRAALDAAGRKYTTIHTHSNQHAGYFPGASAIHLVMHIDPYTGEILGAQAVGKDGVDKRIDVLATAITAGLTAPDLIDLDLSYSPPFGNAKDAINMAGMVADNVIARRLNLIYPDEITPLDDDAIVLDVRTRREYASGHLPGAINIPHTELRGRINELRERSAGKTLAVMCAAGVRSWIAYSVVRAEGFDATMLSGGMQTLRGWYGDDIESILVTGEGNEG